MLLDGKKLTGYLKEYYDNGDIKYEGEIVEGIKNGNGKEYLNNDKIIHDDNDEHGEPLLLLERKYYEQLLEKIEKRKNDKKITFEGEYVNGEKWRGKIKKYNIYGILILECEYIDGEIKGHALEYLNYKFLFGKGLKEIDFRYIDKIEYYEIKLQYEGEYLNGERNGKGKEYDYDGKMEFEGEYSNGKRNGKGNEYDYKGRLIFKGEYCNGIRWNGKYKEYYNEDKLIFEGEYINGKQIGKEYYKNELIFEGEYLKGKRWNGKGKEYDKKDKLIFEGEYLEGQRWNGKGKEFDEDELKFNGEYFEGKRWNGSLGKTIKILNLTVNTLMEN